jgi:putative methyltransferase (TIGR04325 family)
MSAFSDIDGGFEDPMGAAFALHSCRRLAARIKQVRCIRAVRQRIYARGFAGDWAGAFWGIFPDFNEAIRSAPDLNRVGYDAPAPAHMYRERLDTVYPNDYPVLFWLREALKESSTVFDYGGHVGIAYYAYRKYLTYPEDLTWIVCDLPVVTAAGEELAREREAASLVFTNSFERAGQASVLLAAGSLQYVDSPCLAMALSGLDSRPRHLLINRLPLYDGETFVTLQNIGTAFCAYRVFNRIDFINSIISQGYQLVDAWENSDISCSIPFHPGRSVPAYSGLYFQLDGQQAC